MDAIDQKVIARYLKVRNLARAGVDGEAVAAQQVCASLEAKHPGLADAVAEQEQFTKLRDAVRNATGLDPFAGMEPGAANGAANGEKAPEGTRAWNRLAWKALGWATRNLAAALEAEESQEMEAPQHETQETPPEAQEEEAPPVDPIEDLKALLLAEEIGVEIGEDSDTGEELLSVELLVPVALWNAMRELGDEGAAMLVGVLQDLIDSAE